MARLILSVKIALFLSRRSHTGVNNLDFRVINMFRQPVGSDKNEVDIGVSFLLFKSELSTFSGRVTSYGSQSGDRITDDSLSGV